MPAEASTPCHSAIYLSVCLQGTAPFRWIYLGGGAPEGPPLGLLGAATAALVSHALGANGTWTTFTSGNFPGIRLTAVRGVCAPPPSQSATPAAATARNAGGNGGTVIDEPVVVIVGCTVAGLSCCAAAALAFFCLSQIRRRKREKAAATVAAAATLGKRGHGSAMPHSVVAVDDVGAWFAEEAALATAAVRDTGPASPAKASDARGAIAPLPLSLASPAGGESRERRRRLSSAVVPFSAAQATEHEAHDRFAAPTPLRGSGATAVTRRVGMSAPSVHEESPVMGSYRPEIHYQKQRHSLHPPQQHDHSHRHLQNPSEGGIYHGPSSEGQPPFVVAAAAADVGSEWLRTPQQQTPIKDVVQPSFVEPSFGGSLLAASLRPSTVPAGAAESLVVPSRISQWVGPGDEGTPTPLPGAMRRRRSSLSAVASGLVQEGMGVAAASRSGAREESISAGASIALFRVQRDAWGSVLQDAPSLNLQEQQQQQRLVAWQQQQRQLHQQQQWLHMQGVVSEQLFPGHIVALSHGVPMDVASRRQSFAGPPIRAPALLSPHSRPLPHPQLHHQGTVPFSGAAFRTDSLRSPHRHSSELIVSESNRSRVAGGEGQLLERPLFSPPRGYISDASTNYPSVNASGTSFRGRRMSI